MAQMKYFYELTISSSPHVHSPVTTRTIMRDVLIALIPALVGSVCFFGFRALMVALVSVAACVFFEWGYCKLTGMNCKVYDLSAVLTGLLLAFVCPVTIPYWTIIIGDFFAIVVVKMIFGGIGRNIVNPALAGRAFMMSWAVLMTNWVRVGFDNAAGLLDTADAVTAATPLASMHQGVLPQGVSLMDMFLGNVGGCMGETSALLLLIGFVYLLIRKVVSLRIPLGFIGTVAVLTFLFPQGNDRFAWMGAQVFGGGLMLGAIFMATDYVTSPYSDLGKVVFGVGAGLITAAIRIFANSAEGVSFAILIMNLLVPYINDLTRRKPFGEVKAK
jgi:electron transport complex protein RnfD